MCMDPRGLAPLPVKDEVEDKQYGQSWWEHEMGYGGLDDVNMGVRSKTPAPYVSSYNARPYRTYVYEEPRLIPDQLPEEEPQA